MSRASRASGTQAVVRRVLVVSADEPFAQAISNLVREAGCTPTHATSAHAARAALDGWIHCLMADTALPDGSAFEVVEAAHDEGARIPTLVFVQHDDRVSVDRAVRLGVRYAHPTPDNEAVRGFLRSCPEYPEKALEHDIATLGSVHGLTRAQLRIVLAAAVESTSRDILADRLDLSPNTIKTQVREILARTGATSLEEVVAPLRLRAFRGSTAS